MLLLLLFWNVATTRLPNKFQIANTMICVPFDNCPCSFRSTKKHPVGIVAVTGIHLNAPTALSGIALGRRGARRSTEFTSVQFADSTARTRRGPNQVFAYLKRFGSAIVVVHSPAPLTTGTVGLAKALVSTVGTCIKLRFATTVGGRNDMTRRRSGVSGRTDWRIGR